MRLKQCNENFSVHTKTTSGRPAYSSALCEIKSATAKLLVSGQNPKRRHGAAVASVMMVAREKNQDRIA